HRRSTVHFSHGTGTGTGTRGERGRNRDGAGTGTRGARDRNGTGAGPDGGGTWAAPRLPGTGAAAGRDYPGPMPAPEIALTERFQSAFAAAFGPEYAEADPIIRPSQFADFQCNAAMG